MLKFFLWLRYLRKRKIALLGVAAVALSCALLIVVASLFNGFIDAVEKSSALFAGDISIYPAGPVYNYVPLLQRLEQLPQVETAAVVYWGGAGLLHLGPGRVKPVFFLGIEPVRGARLTGLDKFLLKQKASAGELGFKVKSHPDEMGAWVGICLLAEPDEQTDRYDFERITEQVGKPVVLITGTWTSNSSEPAVGNSSRPVRTFKRITKKFRIADVFFTGHYWHDHTLYLPLKEIYNIFRPEEDRPLALVVQIKLSPGVEAEQAKEPIRQVWQRFAADELGWNNSAIAKTNINTHEMIGLDVVRKQMSVLMLILGVICSVGVLLVFCIFYMIVITKQKDIAIIKSCGAGSAAVVSIFIGFGIYIGIIGSALGTALGYVIIRNINTLENGVRVIFGLKLWRSSVYIFNMIPNQIDWNWSVWIILAAILASAIGALIPAVVAARTKPVQILRYE